MAALFTIENFFSLLMLILLQAVLGFDNLLYISLESQHVPGNKRRFVQQTGIGIAVILRIGLLFALIHLIENVENPLVAFQFHWVEGSFTLHSMIILLGGIFILYTAVKEIFHMMMLGTSNGSGHDMPKRSVSSVIVWIVIMNLVFSFDSILSAMALTKEFAVMATAIVIGGVLMIWVAEGVSRFLRKNRMYEVLGLFVLLIVGIMLLSEGAHLAHLAFFGFPVHPMTKTTFYFVLVVLVLTDMVQSRYQKRLLLKQEMRLNQKSKE